MCEVIVSSSSPTDEIHTYEDEIDSELQTSRPKLRGVYAAYAREGTEHTHTCHTPLFSHSWGGRRLRLFSSSSSCVTVSDLAAAALASPLSDN